MKRRAERRLRFRLVFQTSASENTCASVKVDGAALGRRFEGPVPLELEMRPRNVCTGGATSSEKRNHRLLRTGGERPGRCAGEQSDEITPPHSTLSSTMARPEYQISLTALLAIAAHDERA
jgi:hypothetical protein